LEESAASISQKSTEEERAFFTPLIHIVWFPVIPILHQDDFRNLFTASEKLKQEYRSLQEEYRSLRSENGSLKLRHTEMQGELAKSNDHSTLLEVEVSKLNNRCEVGQAASIQLLCKLRIIVVNCCKR
jgi:cell division protein FtsL